VSEALFKEPCLWHTCMAHCDCGPPPQQSAQALTLCPAALQVPERYFQMLLALHGLQNETFPYGWLTWVDWGKTDPTGGALLWFYTILYLEVLTHNIVMAKLCALLLSDPSCAKSLR
jgi:hypothetical protein